MANHSFSALISLLFVVLLIAAGQTFKPTLAASRQGTLITGGISSLVFIFTLTAISNLKMSMGGPQNKSGLFEVGLSLAVAVITAASIHRIAITMCLLFSGVLLYFVNNISQVKYAMGQPTQQTLASKKKK